MPPKDAELNFRGGPWENFLFTNSYKADKGQFELSGCGKPNRIVTVKQSTMKVSLQLLIQFMVFYISSTQQVIKIVRILYTAR